MRDTFYKAIVPAVCGVGIFVGILWIEHIGYFSTRPTWQIYKWVRSILGF